MTALTYLFKQDVRYYFRGRIPIDLSALILKSETKISLGSGCSLRDAQSIVVYLTALHSWDICFDKKSCDFNEHFIKDDNHLSTTMETPNCQGSSV